MRLFLLFVSVCFLTLQAENAAGYVMMVRCDDGSEDTHLSSPEDINLIALRNLNPNKETVVLVHGFNNSYNGAKSSYTTSSKVLHSKMGDVNYVGFYWPSNTWVNFAKAVRNANKSGSYLMHVLAEISKVTNKRIHFVCHSLGARVILSTLNKNEARYISWGKTCFLAAAVHHDSFFTNFAGANLVSQQNYVYFSKNDNVLKYLYSIYYPIASLNMRSSESSEFASLSLDEKIEYMKNLDSNRSVRGISEFDVALLADIDRAGNEAMGLIGSFLGNSKELRKVENVEVSDVVSGHTYWSNTRVFQMVAGQLMSK